MAISFFNHCRYRESSLTIEGATQSPYSHCGMVAFENNTWVVYEAIGPVQRTPFDAFIAQGRGHYFDAFRLQDAFQPAIPAIITAMQPYLGRDYDIEYQFDDDEIYCSELIYIAWQEAMATEIAEGTVQPLGQVVTLGDLHWQPFEAFIRTIDPSLPLDRAMITPRDLAAAQQLKLVYQGMP